MTSTQWQVFSLYNHNSLLVSGSPIKMREIFVSRKRSILYLVFVHEFLNFSLVSLSVNNIERSSSPEKKNNEICVLFPFGKYNLKISRASIDSHYYSWTSVFSRLYQQSVANLSNYFACLRLFSISNQNKIYLFPTGERNFCPTHNDISHWISLTPSCRMVAPLAI